MTALARSLLASPTMPRRVLAQRERPTVTRAAGLLAELATGGVSLDPVDAEAMLRARGRYAGSGEHRLAVDVLLDAIAYALSQPRTPKGVQYRSEAIAWLFDDAPMYSARLCCDAVGIDYDAMRQRLARSQVAA